MKYLSLIACLIFSFSLYSEEVKPKYVNKIISVYDGDSFRADIDGFPDIIGKNMPIRISGVDTPEIRGKCQSEKALALQAKNYTSTLLNQAKVIELKNIQRGKYFRLIADVYIDGVNLSDLLLKKGLAYEYYGKTKKSWC